MPRRRIVFRAGASALDASEVKSLYEENADTNAFTDAEKTKLGTVESGATADQSGAEIKTAYEAEADTNALTDALLTKLNGVDTGATAGTRVYNFPNSANRLDPAYWTAQGFDAVDGALATQTDDPGYLYLLGEAASLDSILSWARFPRGEAFTTAALAAMEGTATSSELLTFLAQVSPALGLANPEGNVTASPGATGRATDGSFWLKQAGSGNTGWEKILSDAGNPYLKNTTDGKRHELSAAINGTSVEVSVDEAGEFLSSESVYTSLLALWQFNEVATSGDVAARDAGTDGGLFHLTSHNSVLSTTGRNPGTLARVFNGSNSEYLERVTHPFEFDDEDWSGAVWVKGTEATPSGAAHILSRWGSNGASKRWTIDYSTSRVPRLVTANEGGGLDGAAEWGSPLTVDAWHLLTFGFIAASNTAWINVDAGTRVTDVASDTPGGGDGDFHVGSNGGSANFFTGEIDQIWMWGKAISSAEEAWLHANT